MQSPFEDLPLLLSRKEKIKPAFVEYTAKLTYDLNVYKGLFDSLDSQYQDEPEDVKESIQRTIIETEGDKFKRFLDEKLDELEQIVSDFSPEEHQCHGYYFRKQLWDFL
ncbi:MAG: class I SAM-dependent methyltransferase, partial [Thermodesulfobacteriota bacterium]|nr:class I SAM-dependent methyltransferase [Thermodesulfobacteriota bacterium]